MTNLLSESQEELDFNDRVINFAMGYNHLVVTTPNSTYIYNTDVGSFLSSLLTLPN